MPKVDDRIRHNSVAAEEGVIVEVIDRGAYLSPLFKVEWDDVDLGSGVLWEYEFVVIGEEEV